MKTSSTAAVATQNQRLVLLKWQFLFWLLVLFTVAVLYWGFAPK
jgi:hypothetical protein